MHLSDAQCQEFHRDGYLFVPALFSPEEVAVLTGEFDRLYGLRRDEIWREKDSDAVRIAFAVHTYSEIYARLARHPRLVEPAMDLLGEAIYIHQFKINPKAAFHGDQWQWHQDYGTWAVDDGMPAPRALNVALFLDDVTEFNGALMFIPGSHELGRIDASYDTESTSYALWTIDDETVARLAEKGGVVAPKGPAGSVMFFDCRLVHASPANISPWSRNIVYLTANAASNTIQKPTRPEYIASQDFTPVTPLADDCLVSSAAAE